MSDNELRDKIERQLCMFFDEGYDGHLVDAAQAIIDDLSLRYETHAATENSTMRRVVGLWAWV